MWCCLPSLLPALLLLTASLLLLTASQRDHVCVAAVIRFGPFIALLLLPAENVRPAVASNIRLAASPSQPTTTTTTPATPATEDLAPAGVIAKGRIELGAEQRRQWLVVPFFGPEGVAASRSCDLTWLR